MTPDPAMLVTRLAVLLEAGAAPLDACRRVAAAHPGSALDAAARAESAMAVPGVLGARGGGAALRADARDEDAWRAVAAAWWVAVDAGAPLAPALHRVATVLRALADARREAEVALAGPRASSRVVLALPPLGLLMGTVLGLDPLGALVGSPAGWALLVVGLALVVAGARWTRRLVARARRSDPVPGLRLDLLALAMAGGTAVPAARELVAAAWRECGLPERAAGHRRRRDARRAHDDGRVVSTARSGEPADADGADEVLAFAVGAGVPVALLLRAEADARRADAVADARRRAAELGTRLLLPLGVCILPAFGALGVAPTLLALLSSTVVGVG